MINIRGHVIFFASLLIFFSVSFSAIASEALPSSVMEFHEIKNKDSIEYEIASYKAAIDLKNLAKAHLSGGNAALSLKYITLGAQLFPYRGDVLKLRNEILSVFITKTNELIAKPQKDCSYIDERVDYLKKISPDNLSKIKGYEKHCHGTLSISDMKGMKFNEASFQNVNAPEEKYHSQAMAKIEESITINTFDTYPAMEQLIMSMRYLGDISLITKSVSYPEDITSWSKLTLYHKYKVLWGNYSWSFGQFCKNVQAIFSAYPSGKNSTSSCSPHHFTVPGISTEKDFHGYQVKNLNNQNQYMGVGDQLFNYYFLPQFLVFDEFETVNGKKRKIDSHIFRMRSGDPTMWLLFSPFENQKGNIYLGEYSQVHFPFDVKHPRFLFQQNFILEERNAKKSSLDKNVIHEFHFNKARTFKAYVKAIELLENKKAMNIFQLLKAY